MLLAIFIYLLLVETVKGFVITVDAHDTVCFYDRARAKDKVTLRFEVLEGGFKDIAVRIAGPSNDKLYESEAEHNGGYTFAAIKDGIYTLCFDNEHSTLTPKILMFHFTVHRDLAHFINVNRRKDDIIEQADLQESVNALSSKMLGIKHEQEYMHVRYTMHMEIRDNVHFRIMTWSIFGPSLLLLMTVLEIYYLKRFFEVKRVV